MDESILAAAPKEVLVDLVKLAQKKRLKGDKGDWKGFLSVHDGQLGKSLSDPAKRSIDDLVSFLKTFSDEGVVKFLAESVASLSGQRLQAHLSKSCAGVESPEQIHQDLNTSSAMDENILASAPKEVLVTVVKLAQKQKLKGDKGDWKGFLSVHDGQLGRSLSDPAKRSIDDLVAFLKSFSDEEVVKFLGEMVKSLSERRLRAHLSKNCPGVESPEQRLVSLTLQHPDYLLNYSFPSQNEEWSVTKLGKLSKAMKSNSLVAMDCEMVLCEDDTEAVVQVCVVDQNMEVKLNKLLKPDKVVTDYRSHITGLSAEDLEGETCSLAHVHKKLKKILRNGTILVGHSLHNDLRALKLDHARVIDTSYIYDTPTRKKPSLNDLCKSVLGYEVRKEGSAHNCLDDAKAAMKLILSKLGSRIDSTIALPDKTAAESGSAQLLLHKIPRSVPLEELRRIFPDFTIKLQPRLNARKQEQNYSVIAVFGDPKEAHKAFESLERETEKDSNGYAQKLVLFEHSTGIPASLYARKMVLEDPNDEPTSDKSTMLDKKGDDQLPSKKRSAESENEDASKKQKMDPNVCKQHVKEIKRLTKELSQKDDEIARLQKILTALTRKQGL